MIMAAGALKTHGITTETVNMILNACAVYKNKTKLQNGKVSH